MDKMKQINNYLVSISKVFSHIGAFCIAVMTAIIAIDVVLRYFFNRPMTGAHEVVEYLVLMTFVLFISDCWDSGMHVAMTIVYDKALRMRSFFNIVIGIAGVIVFSLLAWKLGGETVFAFTAKQISSELMFPIWPAKALAFLCILLFSLKLLIFTFISATRHETHGRP